MAELTKMLVTKRDGRTEPINLDKIHRVIEWAAEGLDEVSVSQVELNSQIQFYDGIHTSDIHKTLIKAAADLISEDTPDYQYMAARLTIFDIRKEAFNKFTPPPLGKFVRGMVERGLYCAETASKLSAWEYDELDRYIDHSRDLTFSYAAVQQLIGKYLVQNRVTKKVYETPQILYMMIAVSLFGNYSKHDRLDYIKKFYDAVSTFKISLPTPIMAGVRTPSKQFSSCVLIECGDTLDSINETSRSIVNYVSNRAGIGINAGAIRAINSPIRGGEARHTGCIPFYKLFQASVKSCSQGGVRGGAATVFYPIWHLEAESLLVLKNNRGVEENRVRHMDYGVQLSKLMYERLLAGGNITLFSPNSVPGMLEAFYADQEEFERLYTAAEKDDSITKKSIPAMDLFGSLMNERASTGRIYIQNIDHCNTHSAFNPKVAPVKQSNLCMEITLPTQPVGYGDKGEIALCTLSAINLGALEGVSSAELSDELEEVCDLAVRALDSLLDYQDYPMRSAEHWAKARRSLGIGVINYAYFLAKNNKKYSDGSANLLTHRVFEHLQYYLLKASNNLAKELGACEAFDQTSYDQGLLPIDTYKKDVDDLVDPASLELDWEELRSSIKAHGLRNSTLSSLMPSETSSQISNATNGIEPPRGYLSIKQSKDGIMKQVVPEYKTLKNNYELLWSQPGNAGYLHLVAIMQKFVDQSISANTNYDPSKYPNNRVPMREMIRDLLVAYKFGVKTLYYQNTRDGASDVQ